MGHNQQRVRELIPALPTCIKNDETHYRQLASSTHVFSHCAVQARRKSWTHWLVYVTLRHVDGLYHKVLANSNYLLFMFVTWVNNKISAVIFTRLGKIFIFCAVHDTVFS